MTLPPRPDPYIVRQTSLGGEECAVEMDREHLLPLGIAEFLQRMHDLDAGVRDQNIDAAERRDRRCDAIVDRLLIGDVHRHTDRLAARRANLSGTRIGGHFVEVGDRHLRAFARERHRDFPADAACRTGDDCAFVFEFHP